MEKRKRKKYVRYSNKLAEALAKDYASGQYTIETVCKIHNIDKTTWYDWKDKHSYFTNLLKEAESKWKINILGLAKSALYKGLTGYDYEEVTMEGKEGADGKLTNKQVKKTKKHVGPNNTLTIFALKTLDPQNFPDKQEIEHSGHMIQKLKVEHFYPDEIEIQDDEL